MAAASLSLATAAPLHAQAPPAPAPMTVLVYEAGPAWKAGRPLAEQGLGPHLGYVAEQFRAQEVVAYGTEDGTSVMRGYYVLAASSPTAVDAFVAADPGVRNGVLKRVQTHGWQVVGGRRAGT